ncbi:hypothetical protein Tco_0764851, partial [Tanacetum coccineum]
ISEAEPPSIYMRCMQWPPISASMIIGPFVPSSSPKGGKRIYGLEEKLCNPLPGHSFPRCIHSFVLCPTSPWNSQNLA